MAEKNPLGAHSVREAREAHRGAVSILGWNCNGRKLASGSTDETVRIWTIEMNNPGRDRRDSELPVGREANALSWNPTHPDQLVTSAADNLLRLWDSRLGKSAGNIKLKKSAFLFLAWNPKDTNVVAAVQQDNDTFFIDLRKQKVLKILPCKHQVNQVKFSADGSLFYRTGSAGGVEVFSFPELTRLHCLMGHSATTHSVDVDSKEGILVSGGTDAIISVFELQTLTCLRSLSDFDSPARSVSISADGNYVAYFAEAHPGVYIDKLATGERSVYLPMQQLVADLCWNPKHMVLAFTGSFQEAVRSSPARYGNFCIYAPKKE